MHTMKKEWLRPTMLEFNDWLKENAEAHERMKAIAVNGKIEDNGNISVKKNKSFLESLCCYCKCKTTYL